MSKRIFYSGDINIEHGGFFYSMENWKWGYVDAVRVTPCSDTGASDNCYWIDRLTVNLREGKDLDNVLSTCGYDLVSIGTGARRRHLIVDAHVAYGTYDSESTCYQLGAKQSTYGEPIKPDYVLRGNTSLKKFARAMLKGDM